MLLDKLLQSNQMNEVARPAEREMNSRTARKSERNDARETSFSDILKSVSEKEKSEDKPKEISLQDLKDKIKDIEKKVDKMSESATGAKKTELEEVKKTLDKVKQLLEALNGKDQKVQIDFGKVSIDFNLFLNNILSGIQDLLGKSNVKELQNLLKFLNKKIDEAAALLKPATAGESNPDAGIVKSGEAAEASFDKFPGKVKIVDMRTTSGEENKNVPVLTGMKKGAMMAEKTTVLTEQKPVKSDSAFEAVVKNGLDKELIDSIKNKDMNPANMQKIAERDSGILHTKGTLAGGSVSRATAEALMQNVAGRLTMTLRDGKSEFKMNLTPPELGHMRMKFTLQDGNLMGKIVVSTPEAKQLFDQNLGELQRQLQQAGIKMGDLDISFGQDGNFAQTEAEQSRSVGSLFLKDGEGALSEEAVFRGNDMYGSRINFLA